MKTQTQGLGMGLTLFAQMAVWALGYWYGAQLVFHGHATFTDVLKVRWNCGGNMVLL